MGYLVCIDPGHAKNTAGKRSPDGSLREYEFNQDIAKRLKAILERHGVQTIFSYNIESDIDTALPARCDKANKANADLFISIHANAHGSGTEWTSGNGWEIYYYKGSTKGKKLAEAIQEESIPELGLKDRGLKTNSLYVTKNTKMPAVLIEHGFFTNREECAKLKTSAFRESCAIADAKGILKYLGVAYIEETPKVEEAPVQPTTPSGLPYQIKITCDALNVRGGPGVHYPRNTVIRDKKKYTIIEEQKGWGKLKSGSGWISLSYVEKV